jgi:Acyl transferase domain
VWPQPGLRRASVNSFGLGGSNAHVKMLRSWSIQPGAVIGHSSGEIAAAYAAGAISRESAWRIAYYRGLLSSNISHSTGDGVGAMISVALESEKALGYIERLGKPVGSRALISTSLEPEREPRALASTIIIYENDSPVQVDIAKGLRQALLPSRTAQCDIVPLSEMPMVDFEQKLCIFLPELERPFLGHIEETNFKTLQKMTTILDSFFWLSQGGGPRPQNPTAEIATGFARVIRQENPALKFITLSVRRLHA